MVTRLHCFVVICIAAVVVSQTGNLLVCIQYHDDSGQHLACTLNNTYKIFYRHFPSDACLNYDIGFNLGVCYISNCKSTEDATCWVTKVPSMNTLYQVDTATTPKIMCTKNIYYSGYITNATFFAQFPLGILWTSVALGNLSSNQDFYVIRNPFYIFPTAVYAFVVTPNFVYTGSDLPPCVSFFCSKPANVLTRLTAYYFDEGFITPTSKISYGPVSFCASNQTYLWCYYSLSPMVTGQADNIESHYVYSDYLSIGINICVYFSNRTLIDGVLSTLKFC
jgi:hypothetical protein